MALFALVLLLAQQVAQAFGYALPEAVGEQATAIFNTILAILVLVGVVVDPTTGGTNDSVQALKYDKLKKDDE